jgi:hypothetical protein
MVVLVLDAFADYVRRLVPKYRDLKHFHVEKELRRLARRAS